jgi:hypothetical protein
VKFLRRLSPRATLDRFRLAPDLYLLGSFEKGLTIYSQQVRALNLAWALIEAAPQRSLRRIAIVGGGFAGLTAAAGLLKKGVRHVTLFERHAVLCPLQQGSDARWVHPRIYEWPNKGSNLPTAALPLLNWNAGRASDVVVEVLNEWDFLRQSVRSGQQVDVYLNVRHLRVSGKMEIEWVGQKSDPQAQSVNSGTKEKFDSIILAVGFGLEVEAPFPYWRNETLGQPQLVPGKRTYLVSGHGDGALIDLFRLRISRFRQDRILVELFPENGELVDRLRKMKSELDRGSLKPESLYDRFENIAQDGTSGFDQLLKGLRSRLRADTDVILQLNKTESFRKAFASKASFQNRVLLFALYKAGGFYPTSQSEHVLCREYGISEDHVIRRHGIKPKLVVEDALDRDFYQAVGQRMSGLSKPGYQPSEIHWTGGYWNVPSPELTGEEITEPTKRGWRQEYLPAATEALANGFVAAVAGYLTSTGTCGSDFRTTLHRTLPIGQEVFLQQISPYMGETQRGGAKGRTFGFNHGTIGYAAVKKSIVRTRQKANKESDGEYRKLFQSDMDKLALNEHSQRMNDEVRSVVAIPILEKNKKYTLAVLFADSTVSNAFDLKVIDALNKMSRAFASRIAAIHSERVCNFGSHLQAFPTYRCYRGELKVIETLESPAPPLAEDGVNYLNLEFTDFVSAPRDHA